MKKLITLLLLLPALAMSMKTIELSSSNSINFNQDFNAMFVAKKQIEAIAKCAQKPGKVIYITSYTPGGSISAGQLFFDTLRGLPCTFHTITVFAASMGYQMAQNLGKRYILPSGTLMSHRGSVGGLGGEIGGELDSILRNIKRTIKEMETTASNRVGISLEKYREAIRDELWMTAEEAVESNHADEVVTVRCTKSLLGSYIEKVNTLFGSLDVEFSRCPIIVAPLSVKGSNVTMEERFKLQFSNINKRVKVTL